jgi:hypothetical protein
MALRLPYLYQINFTKNGRCIYYLGRSISRKGNARQKALLAHHHFAQGPFGRPRKMMGPKLALMKQATKSACRQKKTETKVISTRYLDLKEKLIYHSIH